MQEFNQAFFSLYENVFQTLRNEFDESQTLNLFSKMMANGLTKGYGNDFIKGEPQEFIRLVKQRDENVGLKVSLDLLENNKISYIFHRYPFPNLLSLVDYKKLDNTFIKFKINYLLGVNWSYKLLRHYGNNDPVTEYLIFRSN